MPPLTQNLRGQSVADFLKQAYLPGKLTPVPSVLFPEAWPRTQTHLLSSVFTITNERRFDRPHLRDGRRVGDDPFVVNPPRADRQTTLAQFAAKHHRCSGHKPVLHQNGIVARQQSLPNFARKAKVRPQSRAHQLILIVDDISVGKHQARFRMSCELLLGALKTNGIPDVVLVAQRNQIPRAQPDRAFEICGKSEIAFIDEDSDGKGDRPSKCANHLHRPIGRLVVADHNLVGQPGLLLNTGQLLGKKPLAVIRA